MVLANSAYVIVGTARAQIRIGPVLRRVQRKRVYMVLCCSVLVPT